MKEWVWASSYPVRVCCRGGSLTRLVVLLRLCGRSALRIRDGREKPIDILAKNILLLQAQDNDGTLQSVIKGDNVVDDAVMQYELAEPYKVLEGLPAAELRCGIVSRTCYGVTCFCSVGVSCRQVGCCSFYQPLSFLARVCH